MKLSEKTLKIVLSTSLSILIAQFLQLENPLAAGIIAILSVLDTKKESLMTASARILSTIVAFIIATIVFYFMGFTVLAFGVYLFIYVPVAYRFHLEDGIAPCSVLVTHFMIAESTSMYWQVNGLLLMTIGAIMAVGFNLWMPSQKQVLDQKIEEIEEGMRTILHYLSVQLLEKTENEQLNNHIRQVHTLLINAEERALTEYNNQLLNKDNYYIKYVRMRRNQLDIMKKMARDVCNIQLRIDQNARLAQVFEDISLQFHETNTGIELLQNLALLYKEFRQSPLPQTRDEFESRAILFQLLNDIDRFLQLKKEFYLEQNK
ncbi:aromatic acid exporter family protein [Alkalibacterium iburiense]|uniref:Aromatic acid exporter family protein n=1 Tax=Alkalibacterium iburiense TaxID=290589 RepID=A0ABN0XEZ8_9LACT